MSFLTATHHTFTTAKLPSHISKAQALSLLHNHDAIILLNPQVTSHHLLSPADRDAFFHSEPPENRPSSPSKGPVYSVTDDMSASSGSDKGTGSWRGGWAKRFVPDAITYPSSFQNKEDGLLGIAHAPMGVHSVTRWTVKEEEGALVMVEERGSVTSNRFLMGFIRTTLQESHDKLVRDFVAKLESVVAEEEEKKVGKVT